MPRVWFTKYFSMFGISDLMVNIGELSSLDLSDLYYHYQFNDYILNYYYHVYYYMNISKKMTTACFRPFARTSSSIYLDHWRQLKSDLSLSLFPCSRGHWEAGVLTRTHPWSETHPKDNEYHLRSKIFQQSKFIKIHCSVSILWRTKLHE